MNRKMGRIRAFARSSGEKRHESRSWRREKKKSGHGGSGDTRREIKRQISITAACGSRVARARLAFKSMPYSLASDSPYTGGFNVSLSNGPFGGPK